VGLGTSDLLAKTTTIHNPSVITPYFTSTVSTLNNCFNDYIRYLGQWLIVCILAHRTLQMETDVSKKHATSVFRI